MEISFTSSPAPTLGVEVELHLVDTVARYDSGDLPPPPRRWVSRENRWLASRHGVHADLIAMANGRRRPAEPLAEGLVDQPHQRDLVDAGATLDGVVDHLVGELREDEVRATVPGDAGRNGRRTA